MVLEHNSKKMTINSKLGELMHIKETLQAKNARYEEAMNQDSNKKRDQVIYFEHNDRHNTILKIFIKNLIFLSWQIYLQ